MRTRWWCLLVLAAAFHCNAEDWVFGARVLVSEPARDGVFHHLDGAGRKSIAVNDWGVAVVWEDNRTGAPQVYVATKGHADTSFRDLGTVSTGQEAYEPTVARLDAASFLVAWEQGSSIWARILHPTGLGAPEKISRHGANHVTIAGGENGRAVVAFAERRGKHPQVVVATLESRAGASEFQVQGLTAVESQPANAPQLFPAVAVTAGHTCVAWEDRRFGHTRLLWSVAEGGRRFTAPQSLNEFLSNRTKYDKGSGVTRVALAAFGARGIGAVWMDKRERGKGYGIFGARSFDGCTTFQENEKLQDAFYDEGFHFNPAIAGNARGDLVALWDDPRNGNDDLWLSVAEDDGWGFNWNFDAAATPTKESNGAIALDRSGALHVVWVEREAAGKPTQLWYARGE